MQRAQQIEYESTDARCFVELIEHADLLQSCSGRSSMNLTQCILQVVRIPDTTTPSKPPVRRQYGETRCG